MNDVQKLEPDCFYHIYNRAVGSELMFKQKRDYDIFFEKFYRYLGDFVHVSCYCLIPNHFHLLIRTKEIDPAILKLYFKRDYNYVINQSFSNFFNSYTKTFNNKNKRKGKLFMLPYKRKQITSEHHLRTVIKYINQNPIHHGLVEDIRDWPYSSLTC